MRREPERVASIQRDESLKAAVCDHRRMILKLESERLRTLEEVRRFVAGSAAVDFAGVDRESTCEFARRTLVRFDYGGWAGPTSTD